MKNSFDTPERVTFRKLCRISLQKRSIRSRIPGTRRVKFLGICTRGLVPWVCGDSVSKIQYGGLGMDDCFMRAAYNEEFAMCGANGVPAALNGRMISIEPIQRLANADIRSRALPDIVSGRKGSSLGITEPSGGSDVAGMKTTAQFDSDNYVINGSKTFITGGMMRVCLAESIDWAQTRQTFGKPLIHHQLIRHKIASFLR